MAVMPRVCVHVHVNVCICDLTASASDVKPKTRAPKTVQEAYGHPLPFVSASVRAVFLFLWL
jgi:hypothetical protein